MRAAVLHTLGEPPAYDTRPKPVAVPGRSVVRVTAAPLVPLDLLCASGTSYFGEPAVPYVPGVQGVGVVEQSDVVGPGTRVWCASSAGMAPGDGTLAERVSVRDDDLVPLQEGVADAEVAALGLSAVAAWMALSWRARLRAGESVLVLGGGGAVGQTAIGAARVLGARRVVAACRSHEAADRARSAGADHVVLTGPGTPEPEDLVAQLAEACQGPVDVVLDPVFGPVASAAARVLGEGGRLVNLGSSSADEATFSSALLRSRSIEVLGYTNNSLSTEQRRVALTEICRYAASGDLAVAHVSRPLADVADVWRTMAAGTVAVRCVLVP